MPMPVDADVCTQFFDQGPDPRNQVEDAVRNGGASGIAEAESFRPRFDCHLEQSLQVIR